MAIDKALEVPVAGEAAYANGADGSFAIPPEEDPYSENDSIVIEDTDDGGMMIDFDPSSERMGAEDQNFGANLATLIDESSLNSLVSDLRHKYTMDKASRSDWEEMYEKGLDLLGLKIEERTDPWVGASGVTHPILAEAVVDFQSQAIGEIFPEGGPVRTKMVGESSAKKTAQGQRVEHHMNWMVTEEMVEYQEEMDRLLFALPCAGSAFKKTYWDADMNRIVSVFVPAEDLVVNFGATSLKTATRCSEIMRKDGNWIRRRQVSGFYADIDLRSTDAERTPLKEKMAETSGEKHQSQDDDTYTLIEMHVNLDLEGYEDVIDGEETGIALPYVVTFDLGSDQVLSIYRNWLPDDASKQKRDHFTHYQYIPGFGFYGLGLIHLMGGLAKGATSMLRQLIDAGSLANLPAGYKTRGLRVRGERTPLAPGEFRDVDVPAGKISDNLMALPYKEPSQVLLALLGMVTEEGRRFSSSMDMQMGNMNQETPVGTTLALLERTMKVMTAIQRRLHRSLKDEFKIIVEILKGRPGKVYPYEVEDEDPAIMQEDFDERIDVVPVSDPNASTASHRIMKGQTALQMFAMAPQGIMDPKPLFRWALEQMDIPGARDVIPLESDIKPMDPISENMSSLTGSPIKAFIHQDHASHIQTHMLGMQDPKVQGILAQSPQAQQSMSAMMAHVTEHVAYQYRSEIEASLGTQLPPEGQEMPPEMEAEYSRLIAQAATKLFERNTAEQKMIENEQLLEDPMTQIRNKELEISEMKEQGKMVVAMERLALDKARLLQKDESEDQSRTQTAISNTERAAMEMLGRIIEAASRTEELDSKERLSLLEAMMDSASAEAKSLSDEREQKAKLVESNFTTGGSYQ